MSTIKAAPAVVQAVTNVRPQYRTIKTAPKEYCAAWKKCFDESAIHTQGIFIKCKPLDFRNMCAKNL